jgi:monovalent cation/hydrogen antiporter
MYLLGGLMVSGAGIQSVEAVFLLLLLFVAMFAELALRLKIAYPILLVIAGLLLSFLSEMPRIGLDPNMVFVTGSGVLVGLAIGAVVVIAQLISWLFFKQLPSSLVLIGGLLIVAGGIVISFVKHRSPAGNPGM